MLRPPGFRGAAFTQAKDGDPFVDEAARTSISLDLGIPNRWATVNQVHGAGVVSATSPGVVAEADAAYTAERDLAIAVKTADCVPIVIEAEGAVGVVHAGWRGISAGVIESAVGALTEAGHHPQKAAIGPSIGPCCYEVGKAVADAVGHNASTSWGTPSVDLWSAAKERLALDEVWTAGECTMCGGDYNSYRRDRTQRRQAGIGWLP